MTTTTPRALDGSVALADLSSQLVPLVRAWNHGGSGGVSMTVDATLAVLARTGMLNTDPHPELILRTSPKDETCDWGRCDQPTVGLRWAEDLQVYLPVCAQCAVVVVP